MKPVFHGCFKSKRCNPRNEGNLRRYSAWWEDYLKDTDQSDYHWNTIMFLKSLFCWIDPSGNSLYSEIMQCSMPVSIELTNFILIIYFFRVHLGRFFQEFSKIRTYPPVPLPKVIFSTGVGNSDSNFCYPIIPKKSATRSGASCWLTKGALEWNRGKKSNKY
jgi:hypothetical protein